MLVNETVLLNNIKTSYNALLKNGEIGPDGFDYSEQLNLMINIYETFTNKSFDISLLEIL